MFEIGKSYHFEMTDPLGGGVRLFHATVIRETAHLIEAREANGKIVIFNTASSAFVSATLTN